MKKLYRDMVLAAGSVEQNKAGLVVFLFVLALFVAAAGAPDAGGGLVH